MTEIELSEPVYGELSESESVLADLVEASADTEIEARLREGKDRTTISWSREQLTTIKDAAEAFGMPYQTYIKDAAFRRALDDLQRIRQSA